MFKKIVIVDNDTRFTESLKKAIAQEKKRSVTTHNFKVERLNDAIYQYDLYVIRLDALTLNLIQELSEREKFIILTTNYDTPEVREKILSLHVTDYIITNSKTSIDFVCDVINKLECNDKRNVLVVDDSKLVLAQISLILKTQNINYMLCTNGVEALEHLSNPTSKVDLVITDYVMPKMDGYELVKKIRAKFSFDALPVLILSGTEDTYMISRFFKAGANDYIPKPFIKEEFIGRISNALATVNMFNEIKEMAMTDQLTGLHNRLYFYDAGVKIFEGAMRANNLVSIAMIDIDDFKSINDTYGHEVGDKALIHVANTIQRSLRRSDVFVRFGGEEFVILLPNTPLQQALKVTRKVCSLVRKTPLVLDDGKELFLTVSIGVTSQIDTIDKMLERADHYMYAAKRSGKDRVYTQEE